MLECANHNYAPNIPWPLPKYFWSWGSWTLWGSIHGLVLSLCIVAALETCWKVALPKIVSRVEPPLLYHFCTSFYAFSSLSLTFLFLYHKHVYCYKLSNFINKKYNIGDSNINIKQYNIDCKCCLETSCSKINGSMT